MHAQFTYCYKTGYIFNAIVSADLVDWLIDENTHKKHNKDLPFLICLMLDRLQSRRQ